MKRYSNTDMNRVFDQLANIKKAEPDTNLYEKIGRKIQSQNTIPLFWVSVAACVLGVFIATEFYFTISRNQSNSKDISMVIYRTNNTLYNE